MDCGQMGFLPSACHFCVVISQHPCTMQCNPTQPRIPATSGLVGLAFRKLHDGWMMDDG